MNDVFFGTDPNILLQIPEFFPTGQMSMNRQLNAIVRLIAVLSIILFSVYRQLHFLFIGILTGGCVWIVHQYYVHPQMFEGLEGNHTNANKPNTNPEESDESEELNEAKSNISSKLFQLPTANNPFGNVLLTDIVDNPERLPAPPASNPIVMDEIMRQTKQMIANQYPNSPNMVDRMFGDMSEQMALEQSMRQWVSNPVTTLPGDSLAAYCYGNTAAFKDSLNKSSKSNA